MLAISNCVAKADDIFVAISCVKKLDMKKPEPKPENLDRLTKSDYDYHDDEGSSISVKIYPKYDDREKTIIFRVNLENAEKPEIHKIYDEPVGGIVNFVHDEFIVKQTYCFIFNVYGIYRYTLNERHKELFNYPKSFQDELATLNCIARLNDSIFGHYFFIEQFKVNDHVLRLYNIFRLLQCVIQYKFG
jgi:hypothetical protein